ncbi:hypothetical protein RJ639_005488 [Escallonia herrerae]|uniref:TF-B3 domain-containing protein n=1 Tax=Escallonia herrerae TaxID=1293975 RepID=A0AA88VZS8_9ASTE|nr:hypothetical protein RJ639_005488 [Escallonia herrerae]
MILMYEERSSWPTTLWCKGKHSMIGRGCHEFFKANGITVGDAFKLELIANGKKPIMNFYHRPGELLIPMPFQNSFRSTVFVAIMPELFIEPTSPLSESASVVGAGLAIPAAQSGFMAMAEVFKNAT